MTSAAGGQRRRRRRRSGRASGRGRWRRRRAAAPGRRGARRVTARPAAASRRAATKPSPPLLPGPATTSTGPSGTSAAAASATARPAASISVMPGMPAAMARAVGLGHLGGGQELVHVGILRATRHAAPEAPAAQRRAGRTEGGAMTVRNLRIRAAAAVGGGDRRQRPAGHAGARPAASILAGGFAGPVWPVNPRRREVQGLPAAPSAPSCRRRPTSRSSRRPPTRCPTVIARARGARLPGGGGPERGAGGGRAAAGDARRGAAAPAAGHRAGVARADRAGAAG